MGKAGGVRRRLPGKGIESAVPSSKVESQFAFLKPRLARPPPGPGTQVVQRNSAGYFRVGGRRGGFPPTSCSRGHFMCLGIAQPSSGAPPQRSGTAIRCCHLTRARSGVPADHPSSNGNLPLISHAPPCSSSPCLLVVQFACRHIELSASYLHDPALHTRQIDPLLRSIRGL